MVLDMEAFRVRVFWAANQICPLQAFVLGLYRVRRDVFLPRISRGVVSLSTFADHSGASATEAATGTSSDVARVEQASATGTSASR